MKNKFNNLNSKEWLPFQKSWFKHTSDETLYRENIRFFTKIENRVETILYYGHNYELCRNIAAENGLEACPIESNLDQSQFALIDLRKELEQLSNLDDYQKFKRGIIKIVSDNYSRIAERRFIAVIAQNIQIGESYYPYAWDLAKSIGSILSLKDEKIGCIIDEDRNIYNSSYFKPLKNMFYCLYFRKDDQSNSVKQDKEFNFFTKNSQYKNKKKFVNTIPYWFVLKPQPRKKDEVLHPAKYPEDLVELFVKNFTQEYDNVIDPMSGTGSTQLGALKLKRNGYGTELSDFFSMIANSRCKEFLNPAQRQLFYEEKNQKFKILNKDARRISKDDFPAIDYMITSPPYWDMLNMKGAENQAKRLEKGLKTNYSDDADDIGNIDSYNEFLSVLKDVYFNIASIMKPGSYMTIVVKNIKKKGTNYPFAWDLSLLLQEKLILLPEVFWCQDDLSIAPYGYGNTWVSNTFHQYCLNFQIPMDYER